MALSSRGKRFQGQSAFWLVILTLLNYEQVLSPLSSSCSDAMKVGHGNLTKLAAYFLFRALKPRHVLLAV